MKRFTVFFALVLLTSQAWASDLSNVKITKLNVNRISNQVYIVTSTPASNQNRIPCHTDTSWNYTFLLTTDADKAVYATLLVAFTSGQSVDIVGKSACPSSGYGAVEDVAWVTILK